MGVGVYKSEPIRSSDLVEQPYSQDQLFVRKVPISPYTHRLSELERHIKTSDSR